MPADDNAFGSGDEVTSAAYAAVSWVRARRATWTSAPTTVVAPPPVLAPPVAAPTSHTVRDDVRPPQAAPWRTPAWVAPALRWAARGAVVVALATAAVIGGRYVWTALPALPARPPAQTATAPPAAKPVAAAAARKRAGSLRVTSTPVGAEVVVDGKARGVTPLDLADVSVGRHEVTLRSGAGSVTRTVAVAANATAAIDEAIFSGFVAVYAPFDVTISEGGRALQADDRHQIMLPPGAHQLRVTNVALGYDVVRNVDVKPGAATTVQLTPPPSTLAVTATEPAEVWVDGIHVGDAPLTAAPISLGVHDVVIKRIAGGERRFTVTIGTQPYKLTVDFQAR